MTWLKAGTSLAGIHNLGHILIKPLWQPAGLLQMQCMIT
jgi:hypothetical protein